MIVDATPLGALSLPVQKVALYTLSFRVKDGERIDQPQEIRGVDITLVNGELIAFVPGNSIPVAVMTRVFDVRISALGIYFKGIERRGAKSISFHEIWCAYEEVKPLVVAPAQPC